MSNSISTLVINHPSIAFITLTNTGYIQYTLNCFKSIDKLKTYTIPHLKAYCIGKEGYQLLKDNNYTCNEIKDDDETHSELHTFRRGHFSNITYNKFVIIHENLINYDYVCYTDGDIVFQNPKVFDYLLEHIDNMDMLIQNDTLSDDDHSNLCSGFMFIRKSPKTISLFDPSIMKDKKNIVGWDDQIYINEIKKSLFYKLLPLDLFPTGKHYYLHHECIDPYMIHFNWVRGHKKTGKMKLHHKWYLE